MRSILVVRAGAIGDGLLTFHALSALRTRWPHANVIFMGPRVVLPFAQAAQLVNMVMPIEGVAGLALLGTSPLAPPPWSTDLDLAVIWLRNWSEAEARLTGWGCRCVVGGPSLPPSDADDHVALHLCRSLERLGIGPSCLAGRLSVPLADDQQAASWCREHHLDDAPPVAIHPGSGGRHKRWPAERYRMLIDALAQERRTVLLVTGPAEAEDVELVRQLRQASVLPSVTVAQNLPLPVLAGVLRRCIAFVGNDSGVTHLAALVGTPTLALFGPTPPGRWAPIGPRVRVLQDALQAISSAPAPSAGWTLDVATVYAAFQEMLSPEQER